MELQCMAFARALCRPFERLREIVPVQHDLGAEPLQRLDLRARRRHRNDYRTPNSLHPSLCGCGNPRISAGGDGHLVGRRTISSAV